MPSPQTAEAGLRLPGTEEGRPRKASGTETFSTSPVPTLAFKTQNFWQNFRQHQLTKHQVASTGVTARAEMSDEDDVRSERRPLHFLMQI